MSQTNIGKAIVGVLFAIAITTATVRTVVQLRQYRRLRADDYALLFACITFIASTTLLFIMIPSIYWSEVFILDTFSQESIQKITTPGAPERILHYQQMQDAYLVLTWASVFSVKFAFLFFFRQMVDRLKSMVIYWRIVFVITMVSCGVCIPSSFIVCPSLGVSARKIICAPGSSLALVLISSSCSFMRNWAQVLTIAWHLSDDECLGHIDRSPEYYSPISMRLTCFMKMLVSADKKLVSVVPIVLLWRVRIKLRQKLILGIFLCLNVFIIVFSVLRVTDGLTNGQSIDVLWGDFWGQIQASIAIIVVSITAFRSLLGIKAMERRQKRASPYHYRKRSKASSSTEQSDMEVASLPAIPRATLTGMRTFIDGRGDSRFIPLEEDEDMAAARRKAIKVTHSLSSYTEYSVRCVIGPP